MHDPQMQPELAAAETSAAEAPCPATTRTPAGFLARLRNRFALTPDQAETLAGVKFPCC